MSEKDLEKMMTGIGSICELAGIFRDELIRCGFTREESIMIVASYIKELMIP